LSQPTLPPKPSAARVAPGPPPAARGLAKVLSRNIHALEERRASEQRQAGLETRLADAITQFSGSMPFVYVHLLLVGLWVAINVSLIPGLPRFDPTFVILATFTSVEAIFLSTFVLISQNRASEAAAARADLDLQISLLAEHEVTRLLTLVRAIGVKVGVEESIEPELEELERDVAPEVVLDEIEQNDGGQRP
jgi:uncharacterized membrane protein